MQITVTFKNLEHTPSLDVRIQEKSEKLKKYFEGNIKLNWICSAVDNVHWAELNVIGPKFKFSASAESDSLYKTLDLVVEKLEKQIQKKKEKWKNRIHTHGQDLVILDPENAWTDAEITDKDRVA